MAYSNATFYLDYEGGSDAARTALTGASAGTNGSGGVRCSKTGHGLVTGAVVTLSGTYAGAWMVNVIDADNFDLVGAAYSTVAINVTVTPFGGASKADAWKTFASGATAARIAPGDTIRLMASPDPTLVGNATWTNASRTVTLAGAVTANIATCDSAWTGSANVTASTTSSCKEGTNGTQLVIATAFTTGLVAYFATGTLDLSGYQQVSFWIKNSVGVAASTLSLRLCSDAAGVTTVHTVAVPALPGSSAYWTPVTVNLGSNMNSAIASVALYADLDPGVVTISLDNIIACKASSSADSLTLNSLLGKVRNTGWAASTTYAVGDMRIPTSGNRNGYCYIVTAQTGASGSSEPAWPVGTVGVTTVVDGGVTWRCEDVEEAWVPIRSINGTTVKIDGALSSTIATPSVGYAGSTETVATYKREPIKVTMTTNATAIHSIQDSGSSGAPIVFSGGWNRTDMSTQTGQSWYDAQNGNGIVFQGNSIGFIDLRNVGAVRAYNGVAELGPPSWINNVQCVGMVNCGWTCNNSPTFLTGRGMVMAWNAVGYVFQHNATVNLGRFRADSCDGAGFTTSSSYADLLTLADGTILNNNSTAVAHDSRCPLVARNVRWAGNGGSSIVAASYSANVQLFNCLIPDPAVNFVTVQPWPEQVAYSTRHNQVADSHLILLYGGTIISATDQRHTASGISWKFRPTVTARGVDYPLRLSVAKIACAANVAQSVTIWTRRDSTNINGTLKITGGQIGGVPVDVTVACAPAINTWVQSSALVFTPTEAGVVELVFECYDGIGTTNSFWIDDLVVG